MWKGLHENPVGRASGGVTISELCMTTVQKIIKDIVILGLLLKHPTQSTLFI